MDEFDVSKYTGSFRADSPPNFIQCKSCLQVYSDIKEFAFTDIKTEHHAGIGRPGTDYVEYGPCWRCEKKYGSIETMPGGQPKVKVDPDIFWINSFCGDLLSETFDSEQRGCGIVELGVNRIRPIIMRLRDIAKRLGDES